MSEHPSHLTLDRARLGSRPPDVEAHLTECDECRQRVEARAVDTVPEWATALDRPRFVWRGWKGPAVAGALAAGLAAVVLLVPRLQSEPPYIGIKGDAPSLSVFVKRGTEVFEWDGAALRVGDRVQLHIAPASFSWLTVVAPAGDGRFAPIHRQTVEAADAAGQVALSKSFRVDASPKPNILVVLLSRRPLTQAQLQAPSSENGPDVWVRTLYFSKETLP